MKTRRSQRKEARDVLNRTAADSNEKYSIPEQNIKMEIDAKCESENVNTVENECGAGDNTDSIEATASNFNSVFVLNDSKNEADVTEQPKEVIDNSNGYVELTSLLESQGTHSDCVYGGFQVIPSNNDAGEESSVLAYAWNQQMSTVSNDSSNATTMSYVTTTPYSQMQTTASNSYVGNSAIGWPRRYYATTLSNAHMASGQTAVIVAANRQVGNENSATTVFARKNDKTFVALGDVLKDRQYNSSHASRQSHNEKERKRRSRMKESCDLLRTLVPGISEKTDKATVLEYTVRYLSHLQRCDYIPEVQRAGTCEMRPKVQFIPAAIRFEPPMQIHGQPSQLEEHHYFHLQDSRVHQDEDKENQQPMEGEPCD